MRDKGTRHGVSQRLQLKLKAEVDSLVSAKRRKEGGRAGELCSTNGGARQESQQARAHDQHGDASQQEPEQQERLSPT